MPLNVYLKKSNCQQGGRGLDVKKRKHEDLEKKRKSVKKRYYDKEESIKPYKIQKYLRKPTLKINRTESITKPWCAAAI